VTAALTETLEFLGLLAQELIIDLEQGVQIHQLISLLFFLTDELTQRRFFLDLFGMHLGVLVIRSSSPSRVLFVADM
jgi:hypothetical protein